MLFEEDVEEVCTEQAPNPTPGLVVVWMTCLLRR